MWQEWRTEAPWEDEGGCGEGVPFRMCLEVQDLQRRKRESLEWPAGVCPVEDQGAAQAAWCSRNPHTPTGQAPKAPKAPKVQG